METTNNFNPSNWEEQIQSLKTVAEVKGLTIPYISSKTGYSINTLDRIFNLKFCPQLKVFLHIASVLEIEIIQNPI